MRLIIAVLILVTKGHTFSWPSWGSCPDQKVEQNFGLMNFTGVWYQQYGMNVDLIQGKGRCGYGSYKYVEEGGIDMHFAQISSSTNQWVSMNFTAVSADPSKDEGKFVIRGEIPVWRWHVPVSGLYWVLGTDYNTYSVVYGCNNFLFFFHYYRLWLYSRVQDLDSYDRRAQFLQKTILVLNDHKIEFSYFKPIVQTNCSVSS